MFSARWWTVWHQTSASGDKLPFPAGRLMHLPHFDQLSGLTP
jgi:hypothetical protein